VGGDPTTVPRPPLEMSLRFAADDVAIVWVAAVLIAAMVLTQTRLLPGIGAWPRLARVCLWFVAMALCGLAAAGNVLTLFAFWELQAVATFVLLRVRLTEADELAQRAAGPMLLTGLLMDGLLISGSIAAAPFVFWPTSGELPAAMTDVMPSLGLGMVVAAAGRCGLLPATGWIRKLREVDATTTAVLLGFAILPAAAILFARAGEMHLFDAQLGWQPTGLLVFAGLLAAVSAASQKASSTAFAYVAVTTGAAIGVVNLLIGSWPASMVAVVLIVIVGSLIATGGFPQFLTRRSVVRVDRSPSELRRLAARDWGFPEVWRAVVELPLRGIAQITWFADSFFFDQIVGRLLRRLAAAVGRFGSNDVDEPVWLPAVALLVSAGVLVAMSWRGP